MARSVSSTSRVRAEISLPSATVLPRSSARAWACTELCWRTSSPARWKPKRLGLPDQPLQLAVGLAAGARRGQRPLQQPSGRRVNSPALW